MSSFDPNQLSTYSQESGVYVMKDARGTILYIGKAKNLRSRLKQYFAASGDTRAMIPFLREKIDQIETIVTTTEKEALLLENTLIKKHQPHYNAFLKDDKTYVSLFINNTHPWPRLQLVRYKGKPKAKGLYFGPYTGAFAAREVYDLLIRLFPMRQCSDAELQNRSRPCLLYGIKRCIAPCVGKCTKDEYATFVQSSIDFLKGHDTTLLKDLIKKRDNASDALAFEEAAAYQHTIEQIERIIHSKQAMVRPTAKDADALSLYRTSKETILMQLIFRSGCLVGSEHYTFPSSDQTDADLFSSFLLQLYDKLPPPEEILLPLTLPDHKLLSEILSEKHPKVTHILHPKKGEKHTLVTLAAKNAKTTYEQRQSKQELQEKLLLDMVDTFKLTRFPKRIECFDISHISGSDCVASLIAFTDGKRDTKKTRTYKIKTADQSDDYGALREALTRRLKRGKDESDLPDLIILDGGKGQLSTALSVIDSLDIISTDFIALTKEKGRHDKGLNAEKVYLPNQTDPITLSPRSPLIFFLQRIRDEAHEKAISFHKKRRTKRLIHSKLNDLPGIGPVKQKRLLTHFGSVKKILAATPEELAAVPGLTKKDIATLTTLK